MSKIKRKQIARCCELQKYHESRATIWRIVLFLELCYCWYTKQMLAAIGTLNHCNGYTIMVISFIHNDTKCCWKFGMLDLVQFIFSDIALFVIFSVFCYEKYYAQAVIFCVCCYEWKTLLTSIRFETKEKTIFCFDIYRYFFLIFLCILHRAVHCWHLWHIK